MSDTTMLLLSGSTPIELVAEPSNTKSFRPIDKSNEETLREAWPTVKSLLEQLGLSCSMNTVDCTVLVESQVSTDPHSVRKAHYLFKLLCKTSVPPPLAIELALHGRQHDLIKLGTGQGGMCKKYGIKEKMFTKLLTSLKCSLKELEDLTRCTLFLNENILAAVGPSPRLCWVRNVWKFSITGNLSAAQVIEVFTRKLKRTTMMMGNSDTMMRDKSDFCVLEQPKVNQEVSDPLQMENRRTLCLVPPKNRAKLREAWPMVESSLEELGFMCAMSTVESRAIVVSPCSDPDIMSKARDLFRLLCTTSVPAPLAIELALHGRQHDLIQLGTQKGGMCKKFGINQKKFTKLLASLKCSLKELEDLTRCTLFLNENILTAVGPSPRLCWVRNVWKFSITGNLSAAQVIEVFTRKLKRTTMMMGNSDTMMRDKSDFCVLEQPKVNQEVSDPLQMENRRTLCLVPPKNRAKLREAWPMVESSLEELGFMCAMSTVDSTAIVVSPCSTDPDIMSKARDLFRLLCMTPVPAPLAIELALHGRQHDLIQLGTQKGGMCKKFGINEEEFLKLWRCLKRSLKELEDLTHCTLFLNKTTLTAVGPCPRLCWVRKVWKFSITGKLSPALVIKIFNRKLKRTTVMGNCDTMTTEKNDYCVLEQPKVNHEVSDPLSSENCDTMMFKNSDLRVLEQPKFNDEVSDPLQMENSDTTMLEKSNICILERNQCDHVVSDSFSVMEKSNFGSLDQPMFNHKASHLLPTKNSRSFRPNSAINRAKLKEAWPMLEYFLEELGFLCAMSTVDSTVSLVLPWSTDRDIMRKAYYRDIMRKADYLFKLLFKTSVPAPLAIELALGGRQHDVINLGTQKGGTCKNDGMNKELDIVTVKKTGHLMNEDGAAELTLSFLEGRATRMERALSMVESSLEKYGIPCTLNLINRTVTISKTELSKDYPDAFEKARHLLQLLTTTDVPPSLAIDLALNGKQHEFIEMGFQEGGLCSLYGIKKEQYLKRLNWLTRSVDGIKKFTGCGEIYCSVSGDTITAVSSSRAGLTLFREVVLTCIVEDMDPKYFAMEESKRKLKKKIKRLLA